jgi:hypothetical protein
MLRGPLLVNGYSETSDGTYTSVLDDQADSRRLGKVERRLYIAWLANINLKRTSAVILRPPLRKDQHT